MNTVIIRNIVETKVGAKTKTFRNAKAIVWNTKRRFA
jgi:hypothetical protein